MSGPTDKDILQDIDGRVGCLEAYVEGLLAQQREWLTRIKALETQQATILGHARNLAAHCERLVHEKDHIAATFGRMAFDLHNSQEERR